MKTLPIVLAASILSFASTLPVRGAASPAAQGVVVLQPTAGQHCHGIVRFAQDGDSVKVVADLEGIGARPEACFPHSSIWRLHLLRWNERWRAL
jgi:hypothetical protein